MKDKFQRRLNYVQGTKIGAKTLISASARPIEALNEDGKTFVGGVHRGPSLKLETIQHGKVIAISPQNW